MSIPRLKDDMNIISKIPDYPADGGFTTEGFRAEFDKAGQLIKDYVNNDLAPELEKVQNKIEGANEIINGGTVVGPINMNGQPISGLNDPTEDTQAANKGYADKVASTASSPYNHTDNADFTQFVAQAGIGGKHGTQAYAGDRWILDNGTVTGKANENGNGYSNITLNGTIRQIIANPPEVGTVGVEMVSGTASAVYKNGEVTITSAGGVIKNVSLFDGAYTSANMPKYQPKGYGAELAECMRYYEVMTIPVSSMFPAVMWITELDRCMFNLSFTTRKRISSPTVTIRGIGPDGYARFVCDAGVLSITSFLITATTDYSVGFVGIFTALGNTFSGWVDMFEVTISADL